MFLDFFRNGATLMFSWANITDLIGQDETSSKDKVRQLIRDIGPNWYPIDWNAIAVQRREQGFESTGQLPCFSEGFLRSYFQQVGEGGVLLEKIFEVIKKSNIEKLKVEVKRFTKEIKDIFLNEYRKDEELFFKQNAKAIKIACAGNHLASAVFHGLTRVLIKRNHKMEDNDVNDFFHSTVASAYAGVIFLDNRWKSFLEQMPKRIPRAEIYSKTTMLDYFGKESSKAFTELIVKNQKPQR